jgi:hypothetical protein
MAEEHSYEYSLNLPFSPFRERHFFLNEKVLGVGQEHKGKGLASKAPFESLATGTSRVDHPAHLSTLWTKRILT